MIDTSKYIGIPFKVAGRDYDGVDCFGLYRLIFNDYFNVDLPRYDYYKNVSEEQSNRVINTNLDSIFIKSSKRFGSLVLMRRGGLVAHIGFYLGNNKVIHTTQETGVQVIDISKPKFKNIIKGFYFVHDSYLRANNR